MNHLYTHVIIHKYHILRILWLLQVWLKSICQKWSHHCNQHYYLVLHHFLYQNTNETIIPSTYPFIDPSTPPQASMHQMLPVTSQPVYQHVISTGIFKCYPLFNHVYFYGAVNNWTENITYKFTHDSGMTCYQQPISKLEAPWIYLLE